MFVEIKVGEELNLVYSFNINKRRFHIEAFKTNKSQAHINVENFKVRGEIEDGKRVIDYETLMRGLDRKYYSGSFER